jgi:hypothetical protein
VWKKIKKAFGVIIAFVIGIGAALLVGSRNIFNRGRVQRAKDYNEKFRDKQQDAKDRIDRSKDQVDDSIRGIEDSIERIDNDAIDIQRGNEILENARRRNKQD